MLIYVNSRDKISGNNGKFRYRLPSPILVEQGSKVTCIRTSIPHDWNNVSSTLQNNRLVVTIDGTVSTITIPDGVYTTETIFSALATAMGITSSGYTLNSSNIASVEYTLHFADPTTNFDPLYIGQSYKTDVSSSGGILTNSQKPIMTVSNFIFVGIGQLEDSIVATNSNGSFAIPFKVNYGEILDTDEIYGQAEIQVTKKLYDIDVNLLDENGRNITPVAPTHFVLQII